MLAYKYGDSIVFKINTNKNEISPLEIRSFVDLGFKERAHLQEWIAKAPSCLGEELLIIQKEFSGFSDTQERLDLLALDKQGSLVIIENKLDDTGRDVTWQALKYASYCSGLSKENIRKIYQDFLDKTGSQERAEEKLVAFFDSEDYEEVSLNKGVTQRIILIAANFRKEVTSTVLWLSNFKLRIQCLKITPYSMGDDLFLNVEQIIPTKEAEEFMIGLADKAQDEVVGATQEKNRHIARRQFWANVLAEINKKSQLFQNISPSKSGWIGAGSGVRGVGYNFAVTGTYGRAEVYIGRGDAEQNKFIFDELYKQKSEIETAIGGPCVWERLDDNVACRIKLEGPGNIFEQEQWPEMIDFMVDAMVRVEKAFHEPLKKINRLLKQVSDQSGKVSTATKDKNQ